VGFDAEGGYGGYAVSGLGGDDLQVVVRAIN
jgi:hypothetical protein